MYHPPFKSELHSSIRLLDFTALLWIFKLHIKNCEGKLEATAIWKDLWLDEQTLELEN